MPEIRRFSLAKPTIQTKFHIDFDWWSQNDNDWRVHLQGLLCLEHQSAFAEAATGEMVDFVDPQTAEIQRVDGVQHILISHCAQQPDFLDPHTALVDAVFRIFLSNGNSPLSALELGERLGRPPETILRTLSGGRVYRGLRPLIEK
ncbi:MAG: hypothetical protein ACOYYS_24705 [Chloroflexota bacterium]